MTVLVAIDARQLRGGTTDDRSITEDDHWEADEALLNLIGDDDVRKAFMRIGKWYA